jgi:glycosyltransferase involved in cell wall biosynthesis
VQISSLEMMPYRQLLARGRQRPRVVFDDLNAEYQLQRRACLTDLGQPRRWHGALYSAVQWRRLRTYEGRVCREADTVIAVSETDAAHLRRLAPGARLLVLPNGVDTTAFAHRQPSARNDGRADEAPTVLFTGTMDFRPNVDAMLWFAEAIWPRLHAARPGLRCLIVGKAPDARLLAAARRQDGLEVIGAVPDVRPFLAQAAVYVVPMRMGSGVRLKVLEAMAAGVPVVSTRMGLEGVAAVPGEHVLLADDPPAFAAAVLRLLADPALAARLAARARELVEERYDWTRLTPALLSLYQDLASRAPGDQGSSIGSSTWTV